MKSKAIETLKLISITPKELKRNLKLIPTPLGMLLKVGDNDSPPQLSGNQKIDFYEYRFIRKRGSGEQ